METNKTKEEIAIEVLRKYLPKPTNEGEKNDDANIIKAMEEYANQLLLEKDKALDASERLNTKHVGYIEKLEAELNEYKEKAILWDNLKTGDKLNSLVGGDSKFCEKVDKDKINRLEAELITKDDAIEILKGIIEELRGYKTEVLDLTTTKTRLESELSGLKEKRKEEIEKAYKDGRISMISSSSEVAFMTPEQYYTQTYGQ